jgi:hypothetical protein
VTHTNRRGVNLAPLSFLGWSLPAQLIGYAAVLLAPPLSAFLAALLHASVTFLILSLLRIPIPWRVMNVLLPAVLLLVAYDEVWDAMRWIVPLVAGTYVLTYLPTFWTRVPFFPTDPAVYRSILEELPRGPFTIIDLGCGFATGLCHLASARRDGTFIGVEISPVPLLVAKARALRHPNVTIEAGSFWNRSLAPYDVVYAFLSPEPMPALEEKAMREMKPGALLIANSFPCPRRADKEVVTGARRQQSLYVYRIPLRQ